MSNETHPTIAQLAERETVEAKQLSLGHWFESGWSETFLIEIKSTYRLIVTATHRTMNIPVESIREYAILLVESSLSQKMKILLNVTKSNKLT